MNYHIVLTHLRAFHLTTQAAALTLEKQAAKSWTCYSKATGCPGQITSARSCKLSPSDCRAGLHVRRKHKHKHKPRVNQDDASRSARSFFLSLCWRRPGSNVAYACACACVIPVNQPLLVTNATCDVTAAMFTVTSSRSCNVISYLPAEARFPMKPQKILTISRNSGLYIE